MKRTGLGRGIGALFEQNSSNNFMQNNLDNIEEKNEENKEINKSSNKKLEKENNLKEKENKNEKYKKDELKDDSNSNSNLNIDDENKVFEIKLVDIVPNEKQARKVFEKEKLEELANSIKMFGVIQPIIVEKNNDYYNIVAGERRWRASKLAGKKTIPAIISNKNDSENAQISIIENLQRENLNPVEKARGLDFLMKKFNLSGNEVSELTGINFTSIFNSMKILKLDNELLDYMQEIPNLSEQACLALLETDDLALQKEALLLITEKGLSATEALKRLRLMNRKTSSKETVDNSYLFTDLENKFEEYFGNKVKIRLNNSKKNSGKIIINYNSHEDLERMLDLLS